MLIAAHIGLGASVRRRSVLLLPAVVVLIAFVANGADGLAWVAVVFDAPLLIGVTALGALDEP